VGLLARDGLAGVTLAALASCYSPDIRDCVVACTAPEDCAPGHVCGGDGLCASPEIAGACDELDQPDARTPRIDARDSPDAREPPDAEASPDATPTASLRIVITGKGKVKAEAPIDVECQSSGDAGAVCNYPVAAGTIVTVREKDGGGWQFDEWTMYVPCLGLSSETCTVTVGVGATSVGAIFVEDDD
jgi:hypothetical protein